MQSSYAYATCIEMKHQCQNKYHFDTSSDHLMNELECESRKIYLHYLFLI